MRGANRREFFVILDGSAVVEKPGKKRVFLKPGDFFGEMSLLDGAANP